MKKILTLSLVAVILLTGCGKKEVPPVPTPVKITNSVLPNANTASASKDEAISAGQFKKGGTPEYGGDYYGVTYVKGYATTQIVDEPFCDTNCKKDTYVNFNITGMNDVVFQEYLMKNQGNSYAGAKHIGLGCEKSGIISYKNVADGSGMKEVTLSKDLSKKILASTQAAPVILKLTKEKLTGGSGAPACYSHISKVESGEVAKEIAVESTTGFIEGSMSYPSEMIPPGVMVCAENTKSKVESCTKERVTNSKYMYGIGYKMELPVGTYYVYERFAEKFADFTPSYRAYYSEFVTCGSKYECPSHKPILITVKGGETVTGVDPQDWYVQN